MTYLRLARLWSGLALLLLLSSCVTTPQTRQLLEHTPDGIRRAVMLDKVPFYPQASYQCGPAALATVLNYQGIPTQPEDLVDKVYIPALKGSLQLEMIVTARGFGLLSYKLSPQLTALVSEIDAGHPVLVLQNLSYNWWPQWHYAVAVGYDLDEGEITLRSGTYRNYGISMATFERTWQRSNYWAYVILKPGLIPASASPLAYTDAAITLENASFRTQALTAFRSAAKYWPEHSTVLMALANSEYSAGHLAEAETVLRQIIDQHPRQASAWNNLAFIFAEQHCNTTAHKAIECALQLAPDNLNIQQSYKELTLLPVIDENTCQPVQCPQQVPMNR